MLSSIEAQLSTDQRALAASINLDTDVTEMLDALTRLGLVSFGEPVSDSYVHQEANKE